VAHTGAKRLILARSQVRTAAKYKVVLNGLLPECDIIRDTLMRHDGFSGDEMNNPTSEVMHFSTDALPERDRVAVWRDVFGRHIVKAQFEEIPNVPFSHTATLRSLPGLSLILSTTEGFRAGRTRQTIADGDDDIILTVNVEGKAFASQLGREVSIAPYEGLFHSAADMCAIAYPGRARYVAFRIPRKTITPMASDLSAILSRRMPQTEALRLLANYATALDDRALTSPLLRQAFATHIVDLVALAIGANSEAAEVARGRGLQAARLKAIKDEILARITDERLSVTDIAGRHKVSPRYVQLLFEGGGETFSEYVIEQRLLSTYRMLVTTGFSDWTISAIAFEAGFSNLSYFNRTFRRRYGATPSDVREAAQREDGYS
jgi:AraC-like DNA-binding protein